MPPKSSALGKPALSAVRTPPAPAALRLPKAGEVVAGRIRERILTGELREGDSLAPENELLAEFRVSRPILREALRILESEGLISVSRGRRSGALVHRPDVRVAARYMNFLMQSQNVSLDDVYSTLALIEPAAVRVAAERSTKAQVRELRRQLDAMAADIDDDRKYGAALAGFHRTLMEFAGLKSLTLLMDMLSTIVEAYLFAVQSSARNSIDNRPAKIKSMKAKRKLVDLVEARDAAGAEALWKSYLEISRSILLRWQPREGMRALSEFFFAQPR